MNWERPISCRCPVRARLPTDDQGGDLTRMTPCLRYRISRALLASNPIERREGPCFPLEIAGCRTAGSTHLKKGVEVSDKPYASTSSRRFELRDEFIGLTRHNLRAQKELRWRALQIEGLMGLRVAVVFTVT